MVSDKIKDLAVIYLCAGIMRVVLPFLLWIWNGYTFSYSGLPYFFDPDSFHYYNILKHYVPDWIIYLLPLVATLIGLHVLYLILEKLQVNAKLYYVIMLSCFPLFYVKTTMTDIDTPPYIFMLMSIITYFIVKYFTEGRIIDLLKAAVLIYPMYFIWNPSGLIVFGFITIVTLFWSLYYNNAVVCAVVSSVIILPIGIFVGLRFMQYSYIKSEIQELSYMTYPLFYVIVALVVIAFIITNIDSLKVYLFSSWLIYTALSIDFKRMAYFSLFYAIIIIAITYNDKAGKIVSMIIIGISLLHLAIYYEVAQPYVDRDFEKLSLLDNKEIIGDWGYGYFYETFAPGNVLFKGSPQLDKLKIYREGIKTMDLSLLDKLNTTPDYYVVLHKGEDSNMLTNNYTSFIVYER